MELVQPSEGPNEGGTDVVLTCDRIGVFEDDTAVLQVLFNGNSVGFERTGTRTLAIKSTPGAGTGILIEVVTRGGLASIPPGQFQY